jgi:hypothetical protein
MSHQFQVGDRVQLTQPFERYPHCLLPVGTKGTVVLTGAAGDPVVLAVRWDEHVPNLEHWDNEGWWVLEDVEHGDLPQDSLEPVVARVKPCSCGYWIGEDPETSDGTPMATYDPKSGTMACVECGAALEEQS